MSFPAYEEYKDSGVGWISEVPDHWGVTPIRLAARLESGHTPSRSKPEYWKDCNVPWFTLGDVWQIRDGLTNVVTETKEKVSELGLANSAARLLPKGTVILSRTASVGFSAIMGIDMATTQDFANWVCGPKLHPEYLLHVFRAMGRDFERLRMGSTHNTIYMPDIRSMRCPLPPLPEQTAIASFLDTETSKIDGLVSEQRRLIELLKEKRQAVISHAVTKGLNPDVKMKPSGIQWLGEVPEHWSVQRIKHTITSIEQGWSPQCEISPVESDEQWGVLKVGCVNYGRFTPEENKALPSTLESQPELGIRKDDLLISRANTIELVGSAAVAERDYGNLMLCDKLYRLRMDHSRLLPRFLCCFLTCEIAREPIELGATGASPSMKNIAQSVILELWFAAPNIDEQLQIVTAIQERCEALTKLIAQAERAIELLQERRTALISAAVTGKIDVRGYKPDQAIV